ncbi:MAG: hypothetical protein J5732_05965 [Bacteroidaceae bacterium]|nr:hypothetical protein [Bacteroidaceae bacterium]
MKKPTRTLLFHAMALATVLAAALSSCTTDTPVMPYVTEFVNAYTDSDGFIAVIKNDRGSSYVTSDTARLRPDTLYRRLMVYVVNPDLTSATIIDHISVISSVPEKPDPFRLIQNPVEVQSVWRSGGWLNVIFNIKALDKVHKLGAFDFSTDKRVEFKIFHEEGNDIRSYTKKAYMSIPLWPYSEILSINDTITLSYVNYDNDSISLSIP